MQLDESLPKAQQPQKRSSRPLLLLPAAIFLAIAAYQAALHLAVLERARTSGIPLPPKMYGEHAGLAVAAIALSMALIAAAYRKRVAVDEN